jgi:hypothetical protein
MSRFGQYSARLIAAAVLTFGVSEAVRAAPTFRQADCPAIGNWCAVSRGGALNCIACCQGAEASICTTTMEDDQFPGGIPDQGCVCA